MFNMVVFFIGGTVLACLYVLFSSLTLLVSALWVAFTSHPIIFSLILFAVSFLLIVIARLYGQK